MERFSEVETCVVRLFIKFAFVGYLLGVRGRGRGASGVFFVFRIVSV